MMLSFRLTPELYEELRQAAEAQGESLSTYVRRAAEARLRPPPTCGGAPIWTSTHTFDYQPPREISMTIAASG